MRYLAIVLLGLAMLMSGGCDLSAALAASPPRASTTPATRSPTAASALTATPTQPTPPAVAATSTSTTVVSEADQAVMLEAVRRHLRQGGSPLAEGATVEVVRLVDDYAYVLVVPRDRELFEPAGAILRRTGPDWEIVELGTAFDPTTLSRLDVPPSLLGE